MKLSEAIKRFTEWRALKVKNGTVRGYNLILRQFCLFVRDKHIEEVNLQDVTVWFQMMGYLGWDTNSFIPKAMAIRKLFEFYQHQGVKALDPWLIPIPRKQFKLVRVATDEHYQQLLSVIPAKTNDPRHIRNLAIIKLLYETGARNGEVVALDNDEVNTKERKAIIRTEKNRGSRPFRELFWGDDTNKSLCRWIEKREDIVKRKKIVLAEPEAMFISICAGPHPTNGRRFSIRGVGEMLRRYCNRAKIPYLNAHSFRHGKSHRILKNGGTIADVMNIHGHASVQSVTTYVNMFNKELEERARIFL